MANKEFSLSKEIQQTNKYDFTVFAETEEEAELKLLEYLKENPNPNPFYRSDPNSEVFCYDREVDV